MVSANEELLWSLIECDQNIAPVILLLGRLYLVIILSSLNIYIYYLDIFNMKYGNRPYNGNNGHKSHVERRQSIVASLRRVTL